MVLKKYNKLLSSRRWSNKYPKYDQILALVSVAQKIADDSKKSSEKTTREKPRESHPKSGISHPELWKIQNG